MAIHSLTLAEWSLAVNDLLVVCAGSYIMHISVEAWLLWQYARIGFDKTRVHVTGPTVI